ncbi:MAG: serine/threonine-protein kinase [Cyanobacteriota bacterium]|nr:serine/threonine-protein kinase [Cyanobacteriota bacterium]
MQTGTILRNRYRILQKLGSGGFGDTYLAEDGDLPGNPPCVVKHLQPKTNDPAAMPVAKRLFETEAATLYKLGQESKRIPSLFAHFEEGGEFYLVQEYIDGEDLSKEVTPGKRLGESEVRELLVGILEVLEVAHRQKVIHRDIKPQNLMRRREDGKIVLIDFGAVKEIGTLIVNARGQTSVTIAVGTPGYMPSEQSNGRPKLSSDIYAVGMVGIQALTGLMPQQLPEDPETGEVVWRDRVSVSKEFGNFLEKMVYDHFSRRYQTATEALAAVVAGAKGKPFRSSVMPTQRVGAPPSSQNSIPVTAPNAGRRKFLWWLVFGGMGFAGAVFGKSLWDGGSPQVTQSEPKVSPSPQPVSPPPEPAPPPRVTTTETFTTVKVNSRGEIIPFLKNNATIESGLRRKYES